MEKNLGSDFVNLKKMAQTNPDVNKYLSSFSVVVGDLVLARRLHMGLTQSELAKHSGTTQATISRIEAGDDGVQLKTLNKVFRVLKLAEVNLQFNEEAATKELVVR